MTKRFFDLFISFFGIIIFMPLGFFIMLSIWLLSPGPIFFRQLRVGKDGILFKVNKFRTMSFLKEADLGSFDAGNSSRVTSLGKFLRKTKLDELPQLVNVLLGDMSLVGPRPEVKQWTEVYPELWEVVLSVRPGITDNASIIFRNEEDILMASSNPNETYENVVLPRKLELYIDYVNNQSFFGDVEIILKTIYTVIVK